MTTEASPGRSWRARAVPLLRFLFPARCLACGEALRAHQRLGACAACWGDLRPLAPPWCDRCAIPLPASTDLWGPARGRCAACLSRPSSIDATIALVRYDALARRFLLRGKAGGRPEMLTALGEQLAARVVAARFHEGIDAVVPVPSRPAAALRRGFHPGAEIARPVARRTGIPFAPNWLSRRWSWGPGSRSLGRAARRAAVAGVFHASPRTPSAILLVDDVLTTGATAEAAAAALLRAGARHVRLAVWARTLSRSPDPPPAL